MIAATLVDSPVVVEPALGLCHTGMRESTSPLGSIWRSSRGAVCRLEVVMLCFPTRPSLSFVGVVFEVQVRCGVVVDKAVNSGE